MKKIILSAAAIVYLSATLAAAAEKPTKAPAALAPPHGSVFLGDLPAYFTQPKWHDTSEATFTSNDEDIKAQNKSIATWVNSQSSTMYNGIKDYTVSTCSKKGYSVAAVSNAKITLTRIFDTSFALMSQYEINCW